MALMTQTEQTTTNVVRALINTAGKCNGVAQVIGDFLTQTQGPNVQLVGTNMRSLRTLIDATLKAMGHEEETPNDVSR